jgi:putative transposase
MARLPRIEYPGAFYHVIVRGNQRQDIFIDEQDRIEFLNRVERYKQKTGYILYAYVLMTNHFHLLIETPKEAISKIMQLINFTYTQYFNKKYGKTGHLFQGRYKALLCDRNKYLLELVRYIHLNPVRQRMVNSPAGYRWSSHNDYIKANRGIVETDRVLRLFSESVSQAKRLYNDFVMSSIGSGREEAFYKAIGQQIVGDDKFVEKVERKIEMRELPLRKPALHEIYNAIRKITGIDEGAIVSKSRQRDVVFARGLMAAVWRDSGHMLVDLQPYLKRDLSVLSKLSKVTQDESGMKAAARVKKLLYARLQA